MGAVRVERPFVFQCQPHTCGPQCIRIDLSTVLNKKIPLGVQTIFCSTKDDKGTTCANMWWGARLSQAYARRGIKGSVALLRHYIDLGYAVHTYLYSDRWPDKGHGVFDQCHFALVVGYTSKEIIFYDTDPDLDGGREVRVSIQKFVGMWRWDRGGRKRGKRWFMVLAERRLDRHFDPPAMHKPVKRPKQ